MIEQECSGCGLAVEGGSEGCKALFEQLLARDFSDPHYLGVHRTLVDTYCLQHPDRYCASAKSLAAHLCGLCWSLEQGGERARGPERLQRWLDGNTTLVKPPLPAARGTLTIGDVRNAEDPAAHAAAVDRWARSTWDAHRELHALARAWLDQALGNGPEDPGRHGQRRRRK